MKSASSEKPMLCSSKWSDTERLIRSKIKRTELEKMAEYRARLTEHPELGFLFVELTSRCNLSCMHCGSSCSPSNAVSIDTELLLQTLKTVAEDFDAESVMICLTGGEPMLHPDFEKIAAAIGELGFSWGMTTNATLIDRDAAKKLKQLKMGSISVSLDGLRETHNRFRRAVNDNYSHTLDAIFHLKDEGFEVQVTTVVHKQNLSELEALMRVMLDGNVDSWRLINIEPIGRGLDLPELMLEREDMVYLLDFIREKRFDSGKTGMEVCFGCSHYLTPEFERDVRDECFICGSGIFVASILSNGDIYSCLDIERRPELIQGNIRTDRFSEVWFEKFRQFRRDRSEDCELCCGCDERKYCRGDSTHTWDFDNARPRFCLKNM